jgi:hypothetical protein
MKSVHLRLSELLEGEEFTEETEALFRVLWRFARHSRGPPGYLEITRDEIMGLLSDTMELRSL